MTLISLCRASLAAVLVTALPGFAASASSAADTPAVTAATDTPAVLTLGNQVVLRLRASAGGMTPQQRVGVVEGRLADVLADPIIKPSDVVVYTPPKGAPVIYAMGRRLITVDKATVQAAGTPDAKPLDVAEQWAKRFQQILPRVNWRPSNMPEPKVPANPPLLVTSDFAKVGGNKGLVTLRGKTVFALHGPQHGGLTAQERADALTERLKRLVGKAEAAQPGGIAVQNQASKSKADNAVTLEIADTPLITVEPSEAEIAKTTPVKLGNKWANNIRTALGLPDPDALPTALSAKAASPVASVPANAVPPSEASAPLATAPLPASSVPATAPNTMPTVSDTPMNTNPAGSTAPMNTGPAAPAVTPGTTPADTTPVAPTAPAP